MEYTTKILIADESVSARAAMREGLQRAGYHNLEEAINGEAGNFIIRVCESCFRTFQSASVCPFCGAEYHLTEREIQQVESVRLKEISRLEAEREKQRMEAYRYHVRGKVMQYRSYKQCLNRMELSEFCKLQGYSHKKFIFLAMQLGFFRKR